MLRRFNVDKVKPLSTSIVAHTLDATQDPFHPKEDEEEVLEPEVLEKTASYLKSEFEMKCLGKTLMSLLWRCVGEKLYLANKFTANNMSSIANCTQIWNFRL